MVTIELTIVINVFNGEEFLLSALRSMSSVLSGDQCELLIFDNRSVDRTWQIFEQFLSEQSCVEKIRYVIGISHENLFFSRNVALGLVTTKYVTFLDADDIFHPDKIRFILPLIKKTRCSAIFGSVKYFNKFEELLRREQPSDYTQKFLTGPRWGGDYYFPWASNFFDTEKIKTILFNSDYNIIGDYILVNRILADDKILFVNDIIGYQRLHSRSTSKNYRQFFCEHIKFHLRMMLENKLSVGEFGRVIFFISRHGLMKAIKYAFNI